MSFLKAFGFGGKEQPLTVGSRVPQLSTLDHDGNKVELAELLGAGLTYLYFYPKAGTPGCTLQACDLRDGFSRLADNGIRVVGVSRDKPAKQKKFHDTKALPFLLLADEDGKVIRAFGVPLIFGVALRQSYLIRDGVVVWRDLHARVNGQIDDLLRALPHLPKA